MEKSFSENKIVIQLKEVNESIVDAVKKLKPKNLTVEGNKIIIDVDPQKENPDFVKAIVSAGGHVQFVTERNPDLEETYLKIVKE